MAGVIKNKTELEAAFVSLTAARNGLQPVTDKITYLTWKNYEDQQQQLSEDLLASSVKRFGSLVGASPVTLQINETPQKLTTVGSGSGVEFFTVGALSQFEMSTTLLDIDEANARFTINANQRLLYTLRMAANVPVNKSMIIELYKNGAPMTPAAYATKMTDSDETISITEVTIPIDPATSDVLEWYIYSSVGSGSINVTNAVGSMRIGTLPFSIRTVV